MPRLNFDCEELLHWWEPKTDISFIFNFNWRSLHQLRDAITIFLSARLHAVANRAAESIRETGCPQLKSMIASNPQTPADLLDFLSIVSHPSVLIRIAENPQTGKDTLSRLAFHDNSEVRCAVVDNSNTPESCYKRLSSDESVDVRYRLAENPHAPLTSLYNLLKDENPYVSHRARMTLTRIINNTLALSQQLLEEELQAPEWQETERSRAMIKELSDICSGELISVDFAKHLDQRHSGTAGIS